MQPLFKLGPAVSHVQSHRSLFFLPYTAWGALFEQTFNPSGCRASCALRARSTEVFARLAMWMSEVSWWVVVWCTEVLWEGARVTSASYCQVPGRSSLPYPPTPTRPSHLRPSWNSSNQIHRVLNGTRFSGGAATRRPPSTECAQVFARQPLQQNHPPCPILNNRCIVLVSEPGSPANDYLGLFPLRGGFLASRFTWMSRVALHAHRRRGGDRPSPMVLNWGGTVDRQVQH